MSSGVLRLSQVIDYSSDPDAEDTNVRVDFPGTKLNSWLNSPAGQRPLGDDNKPLGVRWSELFPCLR